MIVEPDFFDHWKTRMLVGLLGNDEFAPMYLMRLWAHCQNRRQSRFDNLPAAAIKGICRFAGDADLLESAMQQSGFVERDENGSLLVVGWDEHNATLVANWTNGKRGGRPPRNFQKPNGNPNANWVNPTETQTGIGLTQIENGVTEKRREEKIGEEKSVSAAGAASHTSDHSRKRFVKPTIEEVAAYCKERGNAVDPKRWLDFYESKGWMVGKSPMKDWKASVRTWEQDAVKAAPVSQYAAIKPIQRSI